MGMTPQPLTNEREVLWATLTKGEKGFRLAALGQLGHWRNPKNGWTMDDLILEMDHEICSWSMGISGS